MLESICILKVSITQRSLTIYSGSSDVRVRFNEDSIHPPTEGSASPDRSNHLQRASHQAHTHPFVHREDENRTDVRNTVHNANFPSNTSLGHQNVTSTLPTNSDSQNRHPQTHIVVNVGPTTSPTFTEKSKASRVLFENQAINIREEIPRQDRENTGEADSEIPLMCSVPEHHLLEDKLGLLLESDENTRQVKDDDRRRKATSRILKDNR